MNIQQLLSAIVGFQYDVKGKCIIWFVILKKLVNIDRENLIKEINIFLDSHTK
jgi:hypothetical protein